MKFSADCFRCIICFPLHDKEAQLLTIHKVHSIFCSQFAKVTNFIDIQHKRCLFCIDLKLILTDKLLLSFKIIQKITKTVL